MTKDISDTPRDNIPCDRSAGEQTQLLRIIDANANRAAEGLRVVEDYARFALDDRHLARLCKELRHDLTAALCAISTESRHAARQTEHDVGAGLAVEEEYRRGDARSVVLASGNRLLQAMRCLEEYTKVLQGSVATAIEPLRYRAYTLQRALDVTMTSRDRLAGATLYVLLDGGTSCADLTDRARAIVQAGAHVVQLRDKTLDDRQLLERARALKEVVSGSRTLLIVNDRPDIAMLAHADGVHVGQQELSVKDVRSTVGTDPLVGVSTHSIHQARQAVLDGANYIGVGPTFASKTKHFEQFHGVELLRQVADEIRLPAFAIGGVSIDNLPDVLDAGIQRVAVGAAIARADDPERITKQMLQMLASDQPTGTPAT